MEKPKTNGNPKFEHGLHGFKGPDGKAWESLLFRQCDEFNLVDRHTQKFAAEDAELLGGVGSKEMRSWASWGWMRPDCEVLRDIVRRSLR